jgi:hypothetical protein
MPKARPPRPDPGSGLRISPAERARMIEELDRRFRALRRVFIAKKWAERRRQRALGLPSIGLPLVWTEAHNATPRYGRNNPLRYQKTNQAPPCLDQSGSPL